MTLHNALEVAGLSYRYGDHRALRDLELTITAGEVFALLGPNGSGKSTLFKLVSTLAAIQEGSIHVFGQSSAENRSLVRAMLGIVFQSPSLDPKLTVAENIRCQAALYGLAGAALRRRVDEVTEQLGIESRLQTRTEELSGGLKRRVELAKGILHKPRLLLLDEPSTGLDPASRLDLWHALKDLQNQSSVTVLLTTHILEEAEKADRIAIMDNGKTVAVGQPSELRRELGEQVLSIQAERRDEILNWLEEQSISAQELAGQIKVTGSQAAEMVAPLSEQFAEQIQSLTLGRPSLEDVFVARTGHHFWNADADRVTEGS